LSEKPGPTKRHLFRRFPGLIEKLPWMELAELPTPVSRLNNLSREVGGAEIWVKRDDITATIYGGNKPRKFEFLFAEAIAKGRTEIMTFGGAGSNHAVATSLFAKKLGLACTLGIVPQPNLQYVRENILVYSQAGAHFIFGGNEVTMMAKALAQAARTKPYLMWFGGSSAVGALGFVEAALELAAQIKDGLLPEPKRIFLATGSCGSHAGLIVGLKLAGLSTEVAGVRIVPKIATNKWVVALLANRTADLLLRLDPSIPAVCTETRDVTLLEGFMGRGYGWPTEPGNQAIKLAAETEEIHLDPTYTGKAFAGMIAFLKNAQQDPGPSLFWNTKNSRVLDLPDGPPEDLPDQLRSYFERPVIDA
jgi:1-aminocyclopropane-1-carboxylate deaminase/D-cysteine desulfhydrase-like pyridoxal-dependent ACC family enzyme